jgi:hypothetical protein
VKRGGKREARSQPTAVAANIQIAGLLFSALARRTAAIYQLGVVLRRLFFEEIKKSLAVTVHCPDSGGRGTTSLLFDQDLGLKEDTNVVGALVGYTDFDRLQTFITCGRIEVQAVAAGMKVGAAALALVRDLYLFHHLDLRRTVVAACDQMEFGFDPASGSPWTRGRLRPTLSLLILISHLTILSIHFIPLWYDC